MLSGASPCYDYRLPPELCVPEARSDFGMVATGSNEATETAIVLKDGVFFAALGTPGSNRIPGLVADVLSNMVDRGMSVRDAVTAPRVVWGGMSRKRAHIEVVDPISEEDVLALQQMGFENMTVLRYPPPDAPEDTSVTKFGGVNAIGYDPETGEFTGVGDPRRWGSAMGPRVVTVRE